MLWLLSHAKENSTVLSLEFDINFGVGLGCQGDVLKTVVCDATLQECMYSDMQNFLVLC